jgi:hypothetical protein
MVIVATTWGLGLGVGATAVGVAATVGPEPDGGGVGPGGLENGLHPAMSNATAKSAPEAAMPSRVCRARPVWNDAVVVDRLMVWRL